MENDTVAYTIWAGCYSITYRVCAMRIIINNEYALGADQYSYQILKINKRKRNGNYVDEWLPIKWYTTVESLIDGFAEYQIRTSDIETLTELLQFKQDLMTELSRSLPAEFRGVV